MHTAPTHTDLFGLARSLLLLAVLAFLAGFGGYLVLGPADVAGLGVREAVATGNAPVRTSAPPQDDRNPPRHI
ncbi:hypothetical protein [Phenylobacterium sp.]|uniref:hypothetical protein n=1 Tax=Phenylobacterium sp. TaxID=1871053 RepID=UPI00286D50CB|nr:hypothetical protein [Phenylobacterium sp.]